MFCCEHEEVLCYEHEENAVEKAVEDEVLKWFPFFRSLSLR